MRGRQCLPGRKLLALHRRLERIVVTIGAPALFERYPPQHRVVGNRVVDAAYPCRGERLTEGSFERLVLPLPVARADALDETTCVTLDAGIDRDHQALAQ